jgi:hypothetical protein
LFVIVRNIMVHVLQYDWEFKQPEMSEEDEKTLHGFFRLPRYIVGTPIRYGATGNINEDRDIVGTIAEHKYYRVMIEGNKTFWTSKEEYEEWQAAECGKFNKKGRYIRGRLKGVTKVL